MHGKILHIICSYKWGVISLVKYNTLGCCNIFNGNIMQCKSLDSIELV